MKPVRYQRNNQNEEGLVLCTYPTITQGQGRKFMSFVTSFLIPQRTSQTQRIFLYRISKDSLKTHNRLDAEWIQIIPQENRVSFSITVYQIPTDFLHLRIHSQERGRNIVIFIAIQKCIKKYKVSVQSSWSLWVLANNPREVKETCDSLFSVHSFLTKALRIPYN